MISTVPKEFIMDVIILVGFLIVLVGSMVIMDIIAAKLGWK